MTQPLLSFQYQGSPQGNFTTFAGLPLFLEIAQACGLTQNDNFQTLKPAPSG